MLKQFKQYILLEIVLPLGDLLMKTKVHYYYHLIKKMNYWNSEEIEDWQAQKLQKIINHFYSNTIYYKNQIDRLGLSPNDFKTMEDLKKLPKLKKQYIYENFDDFIPRNLSSIPYKKASTGGSVSTLKYLLGLDSWSFLTAMKIHSWQSCGYFYGEPYINLGGSSLFSSKNQSAKHSIYYYFQSSIRLGAMNMSSEKIEKYVKIIEKKKIKYIYGYASAIYLLALHVNNAKHKIKTVEYCISTSEVLLPHYKLEIEKAFGNVMDVYGARDGGVYAYAIKNNKYKVSYNAYFETVDEYEEDTGTLLITDLLNYAFPFIRYEIGDEVTLQKEQDKEYNGQILRTVLGRTPDIIKLENNRVLTGAAFQSMFGSFNVSAYKIVKTGRLKLTLQLQKKKEYTLNEEKQIVNTILNHAGEDCHIRVEYIVFDEAENSKKRFIMLK